jgi:hypothetical protein
MWYHFLEAVIILSSLCTLNVLCTIWYGEVLFWSFLLRILARWLSFSQYLGNVMLLFLLSVFYRLLAYNSSPSSMPMTHGFSWYLRSLPWSAHHFILFSLSLSECSNLSTSSSGPAIVSPTWSNNVVRLLTEFHFILLWVCKFFSFVLFSTYMSLLNSCFMYCIVFLILSNWFYSRVHLCPL